jgi:hypothetical protein
MLVDETFRKVEERLREILPKAVPIAPDTELYRDLGLYGDDLALDLVLWAQREFGVAGSFRLTDYAPGEQPFRNVWNLLGKLIGSNECQYKSLTVRDVVTAIETKRWPD